MNDTELVDFLDLHTTLHLTVEVDYYVDHWGAVLMYDGQWSIEAEGQSYREAVEALALAVTAHRNGPGAYL